MLEIKFPVVWLFTLMSGHFFSKTHARSGEGFAIGGADVVRIGKHKTFWLGRAASHHNCENQKEKMRQFLHFFSLSRPKRESPVQITRLAAAAVFKQQT